MSASFLPTALIACTLASALPAYAEPHTAFLWWGEPDPTGADEAFLSLARRRGASALREVPGQLAAGTGATRLQHAVATYQALKLDAALAELDALEREIAPSGGGGLGQGELVDLHAYRAAARIARGDDAAAWDDLLAVARLAPGRPLDPARFAPRLIDAARRAAQSVGAPVHLASSTAPDDALVILDGQLVGRGHVAASAAPGAHLVRAERSGFRAAGQVVEVTPSGGDAHLTLSAEVAPSPAELARRAALSGATEVLAAWVERRDGSAEIALERLDTKTSRRLGRAAVPDNQQLTATALASAVDGLIVSVDAQGPATPRIRWWRRPLTWGLAGGVAAIALGVGLGVGLGVSHETGTRASVDLGAAR